MLILIVLTVLAVAGVVGTIISLPGDGYHRVRTDPTRAFARQ